MANAQIRARSSALLGKAYRSMYMYCTAKREAQTTISYKWILHEILPLLADRNTLKIPLRSPENLYPHHR